MFLGQTLIKQEHNKMHPAMCFSKNRSSREILAKSLISLILENDIKCTYKIRKKKGKNSAFGHTGCELGASDLSFVL